MLRAWVFNLGLRGQPLLHTMSVVTAPRSWSAPPAEPTPGSGAHGAWRFARASADGLQWILKRNCSFSPGQLFGTYLALCSVSLVIALGFTWQGASPVLAFATVEMLLVGAALLVYAHHAADQERIVLAGGELSVEHRRGAITHKTLFRAAWVRVEPRHGEGSLVHLSADGQQAFVGRYLRAELRAPLAHELRAALRADRDGELPQADASLGADAAAAPPNSDPK